MKDLKRNQYIDLEGKIVTEIGFSKSAHAREIQRYRQKGYSLEQIQKITRIKSY